MPLDSIFPRSELSLLQQPPATDGELEEITSLVNEQLQALQARVGRDFRESAKIRFPRGYLREIERWRQVLKFVRSRVVLNNVGYSLMMYDVQGWVLKRTDLAGLARGMLVKASIASLGSVAEALIVDATTPPLGRRQKIKSRITLLRRNSGLDEMTANELEWLWEMRNRQHLFELTESEIDFYKPDDPHRAEDAVASLISALGSAA